MILGKFAWKGGILMSTGVVGGRGSFGNNRLESAVLSSKENNVSPDKNICSAGCSFKLARMEGIALLVRLPVVLVPREWYGNKYLSILQNPGLDD